MTTVVAVMDRASFGADTDVIVVVDVAGADLLWIPRDLWCESLGDRVNRAYARGGSERLLEALAEHGIRVEHAVCLTPIAIDRAIGGLVVEVPVGDVIEFWYPLHPQTAIEEGRKVIRFEPPVEVLSGERVHQWIGARYRLVGPGSDLERIGRQQQLIRTMLGSGFDFRSALADPDQVRISSAEATSELGSVRPDWSLRTLAGLIPAERDGKQVLVPLDTLGPDCSEGRWPGDPAEG